MKKIFMKTIQCLVCMVSWLTVSPLFYYLAKRWKLLGKKLRITFLCISPLALIIYFFLSIYGISIHNTHQHKYRFTDKETLENITGVKFPDFKIVEYKQGETSFHGDYMDQLSIEFKEVPSDNFYQIIDSLKNVSGSDWYISDNRYSYTKIWGNGFPAPNGEDDKEDMHLSINFTKGKKEVVINYGAW